MMDKILHRFESDTEILTLLRAKRRKRLQQGLIKLALLIFAVAVLAVALSAPPLGTILACAVAAAIGIPFFQVYKAPSAPAVLGTVTKINHEYVTSADKGEGGKPVNYARIHQRHTVALSVCAGEENKKILCPPQYERYFKVGDTVLYHPSLPYPANLTNKTTCVCMQCGTTQAAAEAKCYQCGTPLYNFTSIPE